MTEEEIRNRIKVCEDRMNGYLEVGKTKSADRYKEEILKWEKLLLQLNPNLEEELRDYKRGYRSLEEENEKLKEQLSKEKEIRRKSIDTLITWGEVLEPVFQKKMLEILESSDK